MSTIKLVSTGRNEYWNKLSPQLRLEALLRLQGEEQKRNVKPPKLRRI